jgi:hypothetical protein
VAQFWSAPSQIMTAGSTILPCQADVGIIPGIWDLETARAQFDAEWTLWERSLAAFVPARDLAQVKATDQAAIELGSRLTFMPIFYALVRV